MARRVYAFALIGWLIAARALAQAPTSLRVTVVDPSNAVVVGATVTVTGSDPATTAGSVPPISPAFRAKFNAGKRSVSGSSNVRLPSLTKLVCTRSLFARSG